MAVECLRWNSADTEQSEYHGVAMIVTLVIAGALGSLSHKSHHSILPITQQPPLNSYNQIFQMRQKKEFISLYQQQCKPN